MAELSLGFVPWLVLSQVYVAYGDCALEIGITPAFRTCLKHYTEFQAEISEEGLLKQGMILPLLCSDDSKRAIKCMMEYYFQCPEVISNSANSKKLLQEFEVTCLPECTIELGSTLDFRANIEKYKMLEKKISNLSGNISNEICSDDNIQTMVSLAFYLYECPSLQMYIGGSNTAQALSQMLFSRCAPETDLPTPKPKTCPSAFRCVLLLFSDYIQVFFAEVKTPYQKLMRQVGFFCGKTGDSFKTCLRESLPEYRSCEMAIPKSRSALSHVFSMSDARNQSINGFLERECMAFPADFADNICLSKELESTDLVKCLDNLKNEFNSSTSKKSCEYYQSSLACVQTHVTKICGAKYLPAFQRAMRIFLIDATTQNCSNFNLVTPKVDPSSRGSSIYILLSVYCFGALPTFLLIAYN